MIAINRLRIQVKAPPEEALVDKLQSLTLSEPEPEHLLFSPTGDKAWLQAKFDEIPRYLFRVFTPKRRGITNTTWAKSRDARDELENHQKDIFERDDKEVALMLNNHLRWGYKGDDNLVSWSSSLLFVLVYIFHLHANPSDLSDFADIELCIIDTTKFPPGAFLRDMDLIVAYAPYISFDWDLKNFNKLRSGETYFGEYLSQGALKIEDKCQIVSAKAMIGKGLYEVLPEFRSFATWGVSNNDRIG